MCQSPDEALDDAYQIRPFEWRGLGGGECARGRGSWVAGERWPGGAVSTDMWALQCSLAVPAGAGPEGAGTEAGQRLAGQAFAGARSAPQQHPHTSVQGEL